MSASPCSWPHEPIWIPLSICARFSRTSEKMLNQNVLEANARYDGPSRKAVSVSPDAS